MFSFKNWSSFAGFFGTLGGFSVSLVCIDKEGESAKRGRRETEVSDSLSDTASDFFFDRRRSSLSCRKEEEGGEEMGELLAERNCCLGVTKVSSKREEKDVLWTAVFMRERALSLFRSLLIVDSEVDPLIEIAAELGEDVGRDEGESKTEEEDDDDEDDDDEEEGGEEEEDWTRGHGMSRILSGSAIRKKLMSVFAIATLPSLITMIPDLSLEISTDAGSISLCFGEFGVRAKGFSC